jgi:tRNA A-37 threonylcarbamoyl transferase component Bud32
MYEREINTATKSKTESVPKDRIDHLDVTIADLIQTFESSGLNMQRWNDEHENLPEEVVAFQDLYDRLLNFREQREDALTTFEFAEDMSETEREKIRQFDREVRRAYQDHDNFLGNGASAEVYAMDSNDTICVKFITNQDQYNQNNHIRTEYEILSHVYENTKDNAIKTPYPIFSRIHATEGHSYGMEKIQGASLSQILESPEKYPNLVAMATGLNRTHLIETLVAFVNDLHNAGVVHCDLYKRNLMLDEDGALVVIDYGKSKRLEFPEGREDERKSDVYNARQSLGDFFSKLDALTEQYK